MPETAAVPDLPLWAQVGAAFTFIAGAFGVIRGAWKSPKAPVEAHAGDTVVVSASFADSKPIADLADAIRDVRRGMDDLGRDFRDGQLDLRKEMHCVVDELKGVRNDIEKGVGVRIVQPRDP